MTRFLVLATFAVTALGASTGELTVWSAGAVEEGIVRLAAQYGRESGQQVAAQFGTGPELEARLASGASADVLVAPAAVVDRAVKAGRVIADSRTPVGR